MPDSLRNSPHGVVLTVYINTFSVLETVLLGEERKPRGQTFSLDVSSRTFLCPPLLKS